jgi:hypothetical protein
MYLKHLEHLLVQPNYRSNYRHSSLHAHLHQRPFLSRRRFLLASAATTAAFFVVGCQPVQPVTVVAPNPIPGGTALPDPLPFVHVYLPTPTIAPPGSLTIDTGEGDPSTITDFNGTVGVFEPFGGTGTDHEGNTLYWAADVRFMDGEFIDANQNQQEGAFAFI